MLVILTLIEDDKEIPSRLLVTEKMGGNVHRHTEFLQGRTKCSSNIPILCVPPDGGIHVSCTGVVKLSVHSFKRPSNSRPLGHFPAHYSAPPTTRWRR